MNSLRSDKLYSISLSFEEIKLPPFQDIILVGKFSPQGKTGLRKAIELLLPNSFQMIETNHEKVEAVFINKKIIAKMPQDSIMNILIEKVFPFVSEAEIIKVDFKVIVSYRGIEQNNII